MAEGEDDALMVSEDLISLSEDHHVDARLSKYQPGDSSLHLLRHVLEGVGPYGLVVEAQREQQ